MKTLQIIAVLLIASVPALDAQVMMHRGLMQDSTRSQYMQGYRGMGSMTMPGCMYMMQGNMMGRGMMHQGMTGRMNRGMMGGRGMMGAQMPLRKYMMMVNLMPSMDQKLSLTDDQVSQLLDMQTNFKKQQVDFRADMARQRMKMQNLMKSDASAAQLREQLQQCSDIRINMQVAAYETYHKMKDVLNDNQKDQLNRMMMRQMNPGNMGMYW